MNQNDQEFLVQKIRTQYTEKEHSGLEELKRLNARVKRPANIFAWAFGTVGAMVMGVGMSLVMGLGMCCCLAWSGVWFIPGIIIGLIGIVGIALAYPAYTHITQKERERIAPEILRLTDELMQ